MKTTDLMIGDYVHQLVYEELEPVRIVNIHETGAVEVFDGSGDTFYDYQSATNEIQPIPLTQEILEKNGFEWIKNKIVDEAYVFTKTLWDEPELIIRRFDFNESFVICTAWDDTSFMSIGYVHELQHLLKLCGIDKEIEL
jgi:hypothetical protein